MQVVQVNSPEAFGTYVKASHQNLIPSITPAPALRVIEAAPEATQLLRVAAYCRVSTDMEIQESSLESQCEHYTEYIQSEAGWEFAGIYTDNGISATSTESRDEFQRLIKDCEAGHIDFIITKSISRFARNTLDCLHYIRLLKSYGTYIFFEKENLHTGSVESDFLLGIMAALAEDESRSISKNVRWGIQKRFESGTYQQARAPYGYRRIKDDFVIQEDEARVVRRIFSEALCGNGTSKIAKMLNKEAIPTSQKADKWDARTVRALIQNPAYVGDLIYQKTFRDKTYHQKINRGQMDQYLNSDHHPAIISREDFELANATIAQRGKESGSLPMAKDADNAAKRQRRYCFTGKLICGCCGSKMYRGGGNIFRCHTHGQDKKACSMKSVREGDVKAAFMTMMNRLAYAQTLPPAFRVMDLCVQETGSWEARSLRKDVRSWTITDDPDAFPADLFSRYVDRAVVYTNDHIDFHLNCGLVLTERFSRSED